MDGALSFKISSTSLGISRRRLAIRHVAKPARRALDVRAENLLTQQGATRRAALGAILGAAALLASRPALAAYGETANVFGRDPDTSGFVPYKAKGFALEIPSKWVPSKERDFDNTVFRYEDNFDPFSHVVITKTPTSKTSIEDFGSSETFFKSINHYLGEQVWTGENKSEGGFPPGKVAVASMLDSTIRKKDGKKYYQYNVLTRAADYAEGGRHHLINASVGDGSLYIMKVQMGDKRWMKGANKIAENLFNSFTVG